MVHGAPPSNCNINQRPVPRRHFSPPRFVTPYSVPTRLRLWRELRSSSSRRLSNNSFSVFASRWSEYRQCFNHPVRRFPCLRNQLFTDKVDSGNGSIYASHGWDCPWPSVRIRTISAQSAANLGLVRKAAFVLHCLCARVSTASRITALSLMPGLSIGYHLYTTAPTDYCKMNRVSLLFWAKFQSPASYTLIYQSQSPGKE